MAHKPTGEQQLILDHEYQPDEVVKIKAFAGSGKTSTLVMIAEDNPDVQMLYVAFNKAVQLEAEKRFPKNVTCRTSHSLAYAGFGAKYKHKLIKDLKVKAVAEVLGISRYDIARYVADTLKAFIASADPEVTFEHIPAEARATFYNKHPEIQDINTYNAFYARGIEEDRKGPPDFVGLASRIWEMMIHPTDTTVGMIHDGYLKLWQLSNPRLSFPVILLDEAQDTNPAVADVLLSQKCLRIMVGDNHQAIYGFRGSKDFLARFPHSHEFNLTNSFRFGRKIGELATAILHFAKNEKLTVHGLNGDGSIGTVTEGKYTLISRTNAVLFQRAIDAHQQRKRIGFVGGVNAYGFDQILDTYYLYAGQKSMIRDGYIRSFKDFNEMVIFAEQVEDPELRWRAKIVQSYRNDIPRLVEEITRVAVHEEDAEVVLTTAHKCKGLEWDQVVMADSFAPLLKVDEKTGDTMLNDEIEPDEINLVYVASTRAKKRLEPYQGLIDFMNFAGVGHLLDTPALFQPAPAQEEASAVVPVPQEVEAELVQPSRSAATKAFQSGYELGYQEALDQVFARLAAGHAPEQVRSDLQKMLDNGCA